MGVKALAEKLLQGNRGFPAAPSRKPDVLPFPASVESLIRATLNELNAAGSWAGVDLSATDRKRNREFQRKAEAAARAGDIETLQSALGDFKAFHLARRPGRLITCASCRHYRPDIIGSGQGVGSCELGEVRCLWPNREWRCGGWEKN